MRRGGAEESGATRDREDESAALLGGGCAPAALRWMGERESERGKDKGEVKEGMK